MEIKDSHTGNGSSSTAEFFGIDLKVDPVPEPASITMLGVAALTLLGYGWLRRKPRLVTK
jgi:hypothetical protein